MDENKFKKLKKFLDTGKMTDRDGTKINFNKLDHQIKTIDLETAKSPSPSKHSKGGLKGNQKKLAAKAPPPNKIDEKDFKVLREEKAKGRGMGLQDEKVQPGKVMKAKMGVATDYKKYLKGLKKATSEVKKNKGKGHYDKENVIRHIRINKKMGGGMMKKYSKGGGADSGRIGEMKSKLAVALDKAAGGFRKARGKVSPRTFDKITERTKTYALAQSMKDKDRLTDRDIKKASSLVKGKMGGGMMQKPMGYKSGMGPAGAAGPSAGRPGGRRPMQKGPKGGIGSLPKKRSDDLVVIFSTKDGTKQIKRSDLDNMSAPEKKMGGGMMKARRGIIVDDQKRDKRNPNRKPSTKIFDKIGDILKTPYYIRGGKKEKKMGGGMIGPSQTPGYSKGTMVKARGCKLGRTRPTKIT
jgi:hypothetical protein